MNNFTPFLRLLEEPLRKLDLWRSSFGDHPEPAANTEKIAEILSGLTHRLEGNYPFHHPQYAGHMIKPPHPVAWLSYALTATINSNNHALDGGPPTSEMEKEVMADLAGLVGYKENWLGHLTTGGTIANLEALFIAREIHPGKSIAASANAHYTHSRMSRVLNTPFIEIPADRHGNPDTDFIRTNADQIGTLVVTMGTTGLGFVEPLHELIPLARQHNIRVHVDAAYGGFFKLLSGELPSQKAWDAMEDADSIVIDPHKHGLQPYGCGSVLYKDASIGRYFKHDSPYTYFTSDDLHLGEISLECSRAGASAAALWASLQLFPLTSGGLGRILARTRQAATDFAQELKNSSGFDLFCEPDLDIVGYFKRPDSPSLASLSKLSRAVYEEGLHDKKSGYHLTLFTVSADAFLERFPDYERDRDNVIILRSTFMKEEHSQFVKELSRRLGLH